MILQKRAFISARFSLVDILPMFKNPNSFVTPSINEMNSQHDPIKKPTVEIKLKNNENIAKKIVTIVIT